MERPRWPYATKLTISLLLLAFFIFLVARFNEILPPIIVAVIIAYVLNPIVNTLQKRIRLPRALIILLAYLIGLLLIVSVAVVIVPNFTGNLPSTEIDTQQLMHSLETALAKEYNVFGFLIHPSELVNQVIGILEGLVQPVISQTVSIAKTIITSFIWIIFILLVSFYLIKDGAKLEEWFTSHLPAELLPDFKWIHAELNQIWNAFFRGQLLLSTTVAIIFIIAGSILGLPFPLAMGILAGVLEFLPSIGHAIWLFIASLLAYFLGSTWIPMPNWVFMLIIIGLHIFFQQFDLNYLIPRIIGRSVHLHPMVVILGIVAGAMFAGVLGIALAAPTIASARIFGRYILSNLFDMEWTPVSALQPLPPPKTYWWQRNQNRGKSS